MTHAKEPDDLDENRRALALELACRTIVNPQASTQVTNQLVDRAERFEKYIRTGETG